MFIRLFVSLIILSSLASEGAAVLPDDIGRCLYFAFHPVQLQSEKGPGAPTGYSPATLKKENAPQISDSFDIAIPEYYFPEYGYFVDFCFEEEPRFSCKRILTLQSDLSPPDFAK